MPSARMFYVAERCRKKRQQNRKVQEPTRSDVQMDAVTDKKAQICGVLLGKFLNPLKPIMSYPEDFGTQTVPQSHNGACFGVPDYRVIGIRDPIFRNANLSRKAAKESVYCYVWSIHT